VFADNTKYLYLYTSANDSNSKHVWISKSRALAKTLRDNGLVSYYQWSLMGIWLQLRAKYYVLDAFLQPENFIFSGKSRIIQLLHGKGMKKKGYSETQLKKQDYIFATSDFTIEILPESFKKGSRCFVTGYPRNDVLFGLVPKSEISTDRLSHERIKQARDKGVKIILYAPTFRRGEKVYDLSKNIRIQDLDNFAEKNNILFIFNLHNKYREHIRKDLGKNIILLQESDIYPLLPFCDLLITDYSSIFVDFLLLNRPIIFYPYDYDNYSKNEGIVSNYNNITPGPKVFTFDGLIKNIKDILFDSGDLDWVESRRRVTGLYHNYTDGDSSNRIWRIISDLIRY
jgi:CDP-glycerol glycerophosphotransferase (TagB/SpsB family)